MKKFVALFLSILLMFTVCYAEQGCPSPSLASLAPSIYLQEPDGYISIAEFSSLEELPDLALLLPGILEILKLQFNPPYEMNAFIQLNIPLADPDTDLLAFAIVDKDGRAIAGISGYWLEGSVWQIELAYIPENIEEAYLIIMVY